MFGLIVVLCLTSSFVASKSIEPICGPVCEIYCPFGNVLDSRGCPTCSCKESPCGRSVEPLENIRCSKNGCPSGSSCVSSFCCPSREKENLVQAKSLVKLGSCPPPSGLYGLCIARCSDDSSCPGDLKCCGSCPRTCVSPLF